MHSRISRELGVERSGKQGTFFGGDDVAIVASQHTHGRSGLFDPRCADEDGVEGPPGGISSSRSVSKLCS